MFPYSTKRVRIKVSSNVYPCRLSANHTRPVHKSLRFRCSGGFAMIIEWRHDAMHAWKQVSEWAEAASAGVLEDVREIDGLDVPKRRYWISTAG